MIDNKIFVEKKLEIESTQIFNKKIEAFEAEFKCKLPTEFIDFLAQYGGSYIEAKIDILEPNPMANTVIIDTIFGFPNDDNFEDIRENTRIGDGYPVAIPFAEDLMGNWYYLYLGLKNTESKVLFFDIQNRYYWSDAEFYNMFKNLSPKIVDYLEKRRKGLIPQKEEKFNNFYVVGNTFTEFLKNLKPINYDDE